MNSIVPSRSIIAPPSRYPSTKRRSSPTRPFPYQSSRSETFSKLKIGLRYWRGSERIQATISGIFHPLPLTRRKQVNLSSDSFNKEWDQQEYGTGSYLGRRGGLIGRFREISRRINTEISLSSTKEINFITFLGERFREKGRKSTRLSNPPPSTPGE
jgi:hypothetical protein